MSRQRLRNLLGFAKSSNEDRKRRRRRLIEKVTGDLATFGMPSISMPMLAFPGGAASSRRLHLETSPAAEVLEIRQLLSTLFVDSSYASSTDNIHFGTIQGAINAASPNDTILVDPGTYNENLTVNKALTLI